MDQCCLPAIGDRRIRPLYPAFEEAIDAFGEIIGVELSVEADDRAAEQSLQDPFTPRTDAVHFRVGPWDVPEGDDDRLGQTLTDHARQQREVVVLDQHDRPLVARFGNHRIGEFAVDGFIGLPVRRAKNRPGEGDMAKRPQALIGEAQIIALIFFLRQPDPAQRVGRIAGRHLHPVVLVDHETVGRSAAIGDPGAGAGAGDRLERRNQPTGRHQQLDAITLDVVDVGFAVGHHDDLRVRQIVGQDLAQGVGRPGDQCRIDRLAVLFELPQHFARRFRSHILASRCGRPAAWLRR